MNASFSKTNRYFLFLCGILVFSFFIQLSTLGWGLPVVSVADPTASGVGSNAFAVDEIAIGRVILNMVEHGNPNPNWFVESSGQIYLVFIPAVIINTIFFKISLIEIVIIERIVSIIFSLLTIVVTFFMGKEIKDELFGLISALFIAINPYYFFFGTYGKQDAVTTFFITLSLLFIILYLKDQNNRYVYLASFSAGLATSTKYVAGLMFLYIIGIIIYNVIFNKKYPSLVKILICTFFMFFIGFILLTPYSVITPQHFIKESVGEFIHYQTGHVGIGQAPIYEFFLVLSGLYWLKSTPGMFFLGICFLTGVIIIIKSKNFLQNRCVSNYILLVWIILTVALFSFFIKIKMPNQMMIAIPAMMIIAAWPIYTLIQSKEKFPIKKILAILVILLAILSLFAVIDHRLNDNRYKAAGWVIDNVSEGQSLAVTWYVYLPPGYSNTREIVPDNLSWFKTAEYEYFIASSNLYDRYLRYKDEYPGYNEVFVTISTTPVGEKIGNFTVIKRYSMSKTSDEVQWPDKIKRVLSNYEGEGEIIILKNVNL